MADDGVTGTAVLFGGINRHGRTLADTWTWGNLRPGRDRDTDTPRTARCERLERSCWQ